MMICQMAATYTASATSSISMAARVLPVPDTVQNSMLLGMRVK